MGHGGESRLGSLRRKRVTLEDVAAKAGVSVATASVAITGRPSGNCRVSPAVAEKIRTAARELSYRPNLYARNLSTQRTNVVAMLVKRSTWHNAMFYLTTAQRVLRQRGYTEFFFVLPDDKIETERLHLEMCIERQVEGIIILPLIERDGRTNVKLLNEIHQTEKIPIVQVGISVPDCVAPSVLVDESEAVYHAVKELCAMGHRDIAHVTLQHYSELNPANPYRHAYLRYAGYKQAVEELGLKERVFTPQTDEISVAIDFDLAVDLAHVISKEKALPTAIVAYSDFEAAGLLAGFHDIGIKVPDQVSLIGYGHQQINRMVRPTLASIVPSYEHMGEHATQTLLTMIDGGEGKSIMMPASVVMRQSVRKLQGKSTSSRSSKAS